MRVYWLVHRCLCFIALFSRPALWCRIGFEEYQPPEIPGGALRGNFFTAEAKNVVHFATLFKTRDQQETSFSDPDSFCSDILTLECTENSRYDTSSFVTSLCETIHPAISGTEPWVMSLLTKISIYDRWCLQFWMFVQTDGLSLRPFEWLWLLVITVFIVRLAE